MKTSDLSSHIFICSDIQKAYEHVVENYAGMRICPFFPQKDEFLLENAKEAVKEAYIAEQQTKVIVLAAKSFRIEAQNSLLKILEEPPRNIVFILIASAKSVFLPTIRSRIPIKELSAEKSIKSSGLDFKHLYEKEIYEFVQSNSRLSKIELKEMVQTIVYEAIHDFGINFKESELAHFGRLLELAELNGRPQNILFALLLTIMKAKRS